jgi:hypothetical protein
MRILVHMRLHTLIHSFSTDVKPNLKKSRNAFSCVSPLFLESLIRTICPSDRHPIILWMRIFHVPTWFLVHEFSSMCIEHALNGGSGHLCVGTWL